MTAPPITTTSPKTCVFVASPSFSGSTLLTMLLGAHPSIGTIGEMKGGQEDLRNYECSCGVLFVECLFWKKLIESLAARGFRYDLSDRRTMPAFRMPDSRFADRLLGTAFRGTVHEFVRDLLLSVWPGCRLRLDYLRRYTQAFFDVVGEMTGSHVFLDSSKDPIRIKYLATVPSVRLKVIHLVRDGRGVINSYRKNTGTKAHVASAEWGNTHLEIGRVTARYCPDRTKRILYEDLCREPQRVLDELLDFIGVADSYDFERAAECSMHVLGNKMRLKGMLPIRLDEAWRRELNSADLMVFERISGRLNRRYGYE